MSYKKYHLDGKLKGKYLTQRESECVSLLMQGHTMRSAAKKMNISSRTVESCLANMKERLDLSSKSELLCTLYECGFFS